MPLVLIIYLMGMLDTGQFLVLTDVIDKKERSGDLAPCRQLDEAIYDGGCILAAHPS